MTRWSRNPLLDGHGTGRITHGGELRFGATYHRMNRRSFAQKIKLIREGVDRDPRATMYPSRQADPRIAAAQRRIAEAAEDPRNIIMQIGPEHTPWTADRLKHVVDMILQTPTLRNPTIASFKKDHPSVYELLTRPIVHKQGSTEVTRVRHLVHALIEQRVEWDAAKDVAARNHVTKAVQQIARAAANMKTAMPPAAAMEENTRAESKKKEERKNVTEDKKERRNVDEDAVAVQEKKAGERKEAREGATSVDASS